MGLDRRDHAGQHVVPTEQASDFGLDARPGAGAELAQQLAIEAGVQPQTLGDGQARLADARRETDLFGHVHGGQQGAFLVAGGAGATLLAGKGDEHLVPAVRAADAGEALVQVAARRKAATDARPPAARSRTWPEIAPRRPSEGLEMPVHQPPQVGGPRSRGRYKGNGSAQGRMTRTARVQ